MRFSAKAIFLPMQQYRGQSIIRLWRGARNATWYPNRELLALRGQNYGSGSLGMGCGGQNGRGDAPHGLQPLRLIARQILQVPYGRVWEVYDRLQYDVQMPHKVLDKAGLEQICTILNVPSHPVLG